MKKYIIAALSACMAFAPMSADKKKNVSTAKKVYEKQAVSVPMAEHMASKSGPQKVAIKAPEKQLYGEWTILSIKKVGEEVYAIIVSEKYKSKKKMEEM